MNTVDDWQTTAQVMDPERKEWWRGVFGKDRVPVVSFVPLRVSLPGHPDALVYMLDLGALSDCQRGRLIVALAEEFGLEERVVREGLDVEGVPILADGVVVSSTDRALFMSAVL